MSYSMPKFDLSVNDYDYNSIFKRSIVILFFFFVIELFLFGNNTDNLFAHFYGIEYF